RGGGAYVNQGDAAGGEALLQFLHGERLHFLRAGEFQAQALALHGGDPVDHDALGTLGAGRVEVHFQAVGVGHDVVLAGRRELEAGAVVGADFQVQREALRVGRAFADRLGGGVGNGD